MTTTLISVDLCRMSDVYNELIELRRSVEVIPNEFQDVVRKLDEIGRRWTRELQVLGWRISEQQQPHSFLSSPSASLLSSALYGTGSDAVGSAQTLHRYRALERIK
jgi:hypothetical protein